MLRNANSSLFLSIPCALSLCVSCVRLNAELPETCFKREALAIDGFSTGSANTRIEQTFVHDDFGELKEFLDGGVEAELRFIQVGVRPREGVQTLDFIKTIEIVGNTNDPAVSLPDIEVAQCAEGACSSAEGNFFPANDTVNVMDYVETGSIRFNLTLDGQLPQDPWAVDVDVCMSGNVGYEAGI